MNERISLLYPNAQAARPAQYALAWGLLEKHDGFTDATIEEQAHAKCWLTYRAAEGEVAFADWLAKVEPLAFHQMQETDAKRARWTISQRMAEVCLSVQQKQDGWRDTAHELVNDSADWALVAWPPTILSTVRAAALLAYDAWLRADDSDSTGYQRWMAEAWAMWKNMVHSLDWHLFPWRAIEARDDLIALHALSLISKFSKDKSDTPSFSSGLYWFSASAAEKVPFIRALRTLSEGAEAERVIFGNAQGGFALPRHPLPFTFTLTAEQRQLWDQVKAAGVTHVPMAESSNLGDDVQAYAALMWCGLTRPMAEDQTVVVRRDAPAEWPEGSTVLLCGWYGGPFLPKEHVRVIVCGFHLHPKHVADFEQMGLFDQLRERVKAQGFPAGCRDLATMRLLQAHDIEAVFSGCVTSTLAPLPGLQRTLRLSIDGPEGDGFITISHRVQELTTATPAQRLKAASERLWHLAQCAELRTSRLHAALPALALGCPAVTLYLDGVPNAERWDGYLSS